MLQLLLFAFLLVVVAYVVAWFRLVKKLSRFPFPGIPVPLIGHSHLIATSEDPANSMIFFEGQTKKNGLWFGFGREKIEIGPHRV
jgi:hypothetical protein